MRPMARAHEEAGTWRCLEGDTNQDFVYGENRTRDLGTISHSYALTGFVLILISQAMFKIGNNSYITCVGTV